MMEDKVYKYSDITKKIIGCSMEVHRILGNGFQEVVYQRALSIEMNLQNVNYLREKEMPLKYKGYDVGTRRVDFLVEEKVSVEIKGFDKIGRRTSGTGNQLFGSLQFRNWIIN